MGMDDDFHRNESQTGHRRAHDESRDWLAGKCFLEGPSSRVGDEESRLEASGGKLRYCGGNIARGARVSQGAGLAACS